MGDDRRDQHPSVAQLFAYIHGEFSPDEDNGLQEHLTLCRDCCVLLLEIDGFCDESDPELPNASAVADFEALWEKLREPLPSSSSRTEGRTPLLLRSWTRQLRVAWAIAATLALLALGLVLRMDSLEQLARPTPRVAIVDFGVVTRGGDPPETRIPNQAERILILFHLDSQYSNYRMLLVDATGAERLNLSGLHPDQDWNLMLDLPRSALPSGRAKFELFGREGTLEQPAGIYWAQIE